MNKEEIIEAVKSETGIDINEVETICNLNIDMIQDKICSGLYYENTIAKFHNFSFLTKYSEINTSASYSTGTVTVTNDSTTVIGTDTHWSSSHIGWIFKIGNEYYTVSDVVSETEITLTNKYIGETESNVSYSLIKVFYDLPSDFKSMKWVKQLVSADRIIPIKEFAMAEFVPDELSYSGNIEGYIISGNKKLRFFPTPTTQKRIYLCYDRELPSITESGSESEIPSKWHMLFVYGLSEAVWRRLDRPDKVAEVKNAFNDMMLQFVMEDKKITRDSIERMADEGIFKRRVKYPEFPPNYPAQ